MPSWTLTFLLASWQLGAAWEEGPVPPALAAGEAQAIETSSSGDVWISVRGQGLAHLHEGEITWVTTGDGLVSSGIADVLLDRSGRLWAVGQGGFSLFDGSRWETQREFGGLRPRVIFSVYEEGSADTIWLATNGGVGRLADGDWTLLRVSDGLPHPVVHDVVVDGEGAAWLACRTGVARVKDGEMSVHFRDTNFRTALAGPDGTLWFGTSNGIYEWNGSTWTTHLEGRTLYTKLVTAGGEIWAGSAAAGVFRYAGREWEAVLLPRRLQEAEVFDLAEGADGTIWLATSAGVGRLVPAR